MTLLEPFQIAVPEADLIDLRRRLSAARWPSRETVSDWSQGVPLGVLHKLCEHWRRGTTGGLPSGASTDCRTTEPRSMGSRCISFTCAHRLPMPFQ